MKCKMEARCAVVCCVVKVWRGLVADSGADWVVLFERVAGIK
jgi:hypothetical protein